MFLEGYERAKYQPCEIIPYSIWEVIVKLSPLMTSWVSEKSFPGKLTELFAYLILIKNAPRGLCLDRFLQYD